MGLGKSLVEFDGSFKFMSVEPVLLIAPAEALAPAPRAGTPPTAGAGRLRKGPGGVFGNDDKLTDLWIEMLSADGDCCIPAPVRSFALLGCEAAASELAFCFS